MTIRLLIDGYNLLFASDVFASPVGPPTLRRTRAALLAFLVEVIEVRQRRATVVVFDATQAPPWLPHEEMCEGMRVLFSRNPDDADSLIESLLEAERAPREILLISSDHRLQRAARQRGAKFVDSDQWYRERIRARNSTISPDVDSKPQVDSPQTWLCAFNDVDSSRLESELPARLSEQKSVQKSVALPTSIKPTAKPGTHFRRRASRKLLQPPEKLHGGSNPFPPGYGEDLGPDNLDDV